MLLMFSILIGSGVIMTLLILAVSPGKIEPFLDENGKPMANSISEKVFVNIGGVKQGMFIMGKNLENPVLLFVHGGPCFSEYFLVDKYPAGLEEMFTVCYWEQRGGGISYNPDIPVECITMEQLTSDAIEVTNYLRERFGKEKIYLMAHSGGTIFAIRAAAEAPELFQAYIGMAQITRQKESEKLAYEYMMEQYILSGNTGMIKKLEQYPIYESESHIIPFFKSPLRDQAMHELGIGTMRDMRSIFKGVFLPVMACRAYTFREKINIWVSKISFINKTNLKGQSLSIDLTADVRSLDVPAYFFSGAYDLTVNHDLSKAYLEQLNAPVKGFYTFEKSAHSPLYEEPERIQQILREDVLTGMNNLSDIL